MAPPPHVEVRSMVGRLAAGHLTSPLRMHLSDHLPSCVPSRYVVISQWARDIGRPQLRSARCGRTVRLDLAKVARLAVSSGRTETCHHEEGLVGYTRVCTGRGRGTRPRPEAARDPAQLPGRGPRSLPPRGGGT